MRLARCAQVKECLDFLSRYYMTHWPFQLRVMDILGELDEGMDPVIFYKALVRAAGDMDTPGLIDAAYGADEALERMVVEGSGTMPKLARIFREVMTGQELTKEQVLSWASQELSEFARTIETAHGSARKN